MNREYHKWWSPALGREMEALLFGSAGPRLLVFPTRQQRFFEYEDRGMVVALRPALEAGKLQVLCLDSVDDEGLYAFHKPAEERLGRYLEYERYVLQEALPFFEARGPGTPLTAHGCSLGAFHAMSIALRNPGKFQRVLAFSGRYDLTTQIGEFHTLFYGYETAALTQVMPSRFVPKLRASLRLRELQRMEITMAIGDEDPFYQDNVALARMLQRKKIPCALHAWCGEAHRFRYWRQMVRVHLGLTQI